LRLAEASICDGGIVALDDILHYSFCGVISGLARYKYNGGKLTAFALVPNKLFLTNVKSAEQYRECMKRQFPDFLGKADLEMMSDPVEFYYDRPDIVDPPVTVELDPRVELDEIKNSKRYKIASALADTYNRMIGKA
jgi:hypothetical protein